MAMFPAAPAPETPAERFERDVEQRRGDNNGATLDMTTGKWTANANGKLAYVAADALGGRTDREFAHRRGDHYLDEDGVMQYDVDGRNSREYADKSTLVSAVNDKVYDGAHLLKGSPVEAPAEEEE